MLKQRQTHIHRNNVLYIQRILYLYTPTHPFFTCMNFRDFENICFRFLRFLFFFFKKTKQKKIFFPWSSIIVHYTIAHKRNENIYELSECVELYIPICVYTKIYLCEMINPWIYLTILSAQDRLIILSKEYFCFRFYFYFLNKI